MLQSEHYELKLVEGSDIVNPLVIDRPNYEAIDGIMYGNESQAIGNATELKSGTIHAINRSKGNQRFFIFTATSNYELGDTFTVDSVPVTALMPNGTALPNMAYVVNGTVLCSLVGTLLTVYTVGSALADDSLRLGGELPAYYAKQSDLTATDNLARGASTLSLANEQAIREINSNLTYKIGMPDYSNVIATITTYSATYTATQPCVLVGSISDDSDGYVAHVSVNGTLVAEGGAASPTSTSFRVLTPIFIPINTGDIVTTRANRGNYNIRVLGYIN